MDDAMMPAVLIVVVLALCAMSAVVGYELGERDERSRCGEEYLDGKICFQTRQP